MAIRVNGGNDMKKLTFSMACVLTISLMTADAADAQRRGDRQGSDVNRLIRQFTSGNNQQRGADVRARGSVSANQSRNNGRGLDLGQVIGNRVRNEIGNAVGDAIGVPGRAGNQIINGRSVNGRVGIDGRAGLNGRNFNGRTGVNGRFDNNRNLRNNSRYRNNSVAAAILNRFPQASRVFTPRNNRQRGGFYTAQGTHYYYPIATGSAVTNSGSVAPAVQQAGATYVEGSTVVTARGSSQQTAPSPVEMKFGGYAYAEQLCAVMPEVVNTLCLDMHYNYRGAANFDEAYRTAYTMLENSKQLSAAHDAGDRNKVKELAKTIDRLQHVVEDQTAGWTRNESKQVGELGIVTKLQITGDVVHHLLHDIGVSEGEHAENNGAPKVTTEEPPAPQKQ